jgi:predicted negative regulator of RcsB-dependent stress response
MAIELMDEHEQSEVVRKWLADNLGSILWGIIGGLILIAGYQFWIKLGNERQEQAQLQYVTLVEAAEKKDEAQVAQIGKLLREKFPRSPYASFSAMREADALLAQGKADEAAQLYEFARDKARLEELGELATLRLARVRLSQGQADAALKLVDTLKPDAFKAVALELRGDALVALHRETEARAAYEQALTVVDATAPNRQALEMKSNELASVAAPAATTPPTTPAKAGT